MLKSKLVSYTCALALLLWSNIFAAPLPIIHHDVSHPQETNEHEKAHKNSGAPVSNVANKYPAKIADAFKKNTLDDQEKEKEKNNYEESTFNDALVKYTGYLAYATFILSAATIFLGIVTWQLRVIARNDFWATHRAKILVHTFEYCSDDTRTVSAIFTYVNTGTTSAKINRISFNIFCSDKLRPGAAMKTHEFIPVKQILPGGRADFSVESNISENSAYVRNVKNERGQSNIDLLCIGKITYSDSSGASRETGFCRKLGSDSKSWLKVENSDYEYSY